MPRHFIQYLSYLSVLLPGVLHATSVIEFSDTNFEAIESDRLGVITLRITPPLQKSSVVILRTSDGTASSRGDGLGYWGNESGRLIILPFGVTQVETDFTVRDDCNLEPPETVNLVLSDPGAGLVLGTRRTATLTIRDGPPVIYIIQHVRIIIKGSVKSIDKSSRVFQSGLHGAEIKSGVCRGDLSRDEPWRPARADLPG